MNKLHLTKLLNEQIKPAMGCTEPASIALACAHAVSVLKKYAKVQANDVTGIDVTLDKFVFRNARAVGIPKSGGETGIKIAAAMGIFCNPKYALNIFSSFDIKHLPAAEQLSNKVRISVLKSDLLYIKVKIFADRNYSAVTIKYSHAGIEKIKFKNRIIFENKIKRINNISTGMNNISKMRIEEIILLAEKGGQKNLAKIKDLVETNWMAANFGVKNKCGLGIGANLAHLCDKKNGIAEYVQSMTAAASDARMGGSDIGVVAVCGSGNQGIMCSVPIKAAGNMLHINEKRIIRAVLISILIECYLTSKFGYISDICGAVMKAGFGATAGLTYLLGGNEKQIENAMELFAGDLTGMICDGAKSGCSLKLATSSYSAVKAALLSLKGITAPAGCGIIGINFEGTIDNIITLKK